MWYEVILTGDSPPIYTEKDSIPDASLDERAWAVATCPPFVLMLYIGAAGILLMERYFAVN